MLRLVKFVAIAAVFGWGGIAQAGLMATLTSADSCTGDGGDYGGVAVAVTSATECQFGDVFIDKRFNGADKMSVNINNMFKHSDWQFGQRVFGFGNGMPSPTGHDYDIGFEVDGVRTGGDWSVDDIWSSVSDLMFVVNFKPIDDENAHPGVFVGFLVDVGTTEGSYDRIFDGAYLSRMTAYVRTVPEPGTLVLLGLGLVGLGFASRRKRS